MGPPARTIPSTLRCRRPVSPATVRSMVATTLTPRPSARSSTSVQLTVRAVWPSTPSSAPTAPSSTRTTSSATGGSTLTAPRPRLWPRRRTESSLLLEVQRMRLPLPLPRRATLPMLPLEGPLPNPITPLPPNPPLLPPMRVTERLKTIFLGTTKLYSLGPRCKDCTALHKLYILYKLQMLNKLYKLFKLYKLHKLYKLYNLYRMNNLYSAVQMLYPSRTVQHTILHVNLIVPPTI